PASSPGESDPGARRELFLNALADDFNTPRALAQVFELVGDANREEVPGAPETVRDMLSILGLESIAHPEEGAGEEAEALMREREEARAEKDFARADEIRDELAALGWTVRDSAEGPSLVPKG
ncbi:MAG TPA: DALR domain-containing protein, partial [Thermoanaerobaculia bacterium]